MFFTALLSCVSVALVCGRVIKKSTDSELVFVSVVFRHGDRTGIDFYPNDPYQNKSYWPEGFGQLTNIGKQQQYVLGKWLRQRYDGFLPKKYLAEDIYVQSTDLDRALMSAATNLAALYEPDFEDNWSKDIKWQPIPIHTIPRLLDNEVAGKRLCPKYAKMKEEVHKTEYYSNLYKRHEEDFKYLSLHTGSNINNIDDIVDPQDDFYVEELKGYVLPEWSKKVYPEPLTSLVPYWIKAETFTPEMARLRIGLLLGKIVEKQQNKINSSSSYKMLMISGHDTTVGGIMNALNMFQLHIPSYCSTLMIELRQRSGQYFVEFYYKQLNESEATLLKLPDCETSCPFSKFKDIVGPFVPDNWEEECKL